MIGLRGNGTHIKFFTHAESFADDGNEDSCGACRGIGVLICCENCPAAFHATCAGYSVPQTLITVLQLCTLAISGYALYLSLTPAVQPKQALQPFGAMTSLDFTSHAACIKSMHWHSMHCH